MKPGRKPTPTAVLEKRGSWRAKKRLSEPEATPGEPSMPTFLDAEAKRCWKRLAKSLGGMRVLCKDDREALAGLCQQWSLFVKTSKMLNAITNATELLSYKGLASTNSTAFQNYTRMCESFGLTPSSRSRVNVPKADGSKTEGKNRFRPKIIKLEAG